MEVIKTYLDNVFAAFEQSERVALLKLNMLESMEEKYNELKREGKSEHEAIGCVISNFGNIDEISAELGLEQIGAETESESEIPVSLTREEAYEYVNQSKKSGMWIGLGVWIIMTGISAMLLIAGLAGQSGEVSGNIFESVYSNIIRFGEQTPGDSGIASGVGVFALLASIVVAVPIFIINGLRISAFEDYEKRFIRLDKETRAELEELRIRFIPRFAVMISVGVGLILLAVGVLVILKLRESTVLPIIVLLFFIGFAVFMFVSAGMRYSAYDVILGKGDYKNKLKMGKGERIIASIASAYWPLIVAVYLIVSFLFGSWHISWIIWPVSGVLFAAIAGGIGAWYGTKEI